MSSRALRSLGFVGLAGGLWLVSALLPATPARAAGPTGEIKLGVKRQRALGAAVAAPGWLFIQSPRRC